MSKQFKLTLSFFFFLIVIYSGLRLGFYFLNHDFFTGIDSSRVAFAFLHGIRFDISAIILLNLPVLFFFNFPGYPNRWKWYRVFILILFIAVNIVGFILNIADFGYFPTVQRRLLFEPYTKTSDLIHLAPSLLTRYIHLTVILVAAIALLIFSVQKLYRWLDLKIERRETWIKQIISFVLLVLLSMIGYRGGFQLKPIRQTDAFVSTNKALGYLTLNSTYTVLRSLFQKSLPEYNVIPEDEARTIIRELLVQHDERLLDSGYYFLREKIPSEPERKLNVVIFIMESWTAQYVGSISGGKTITPFFDSLASHGMLFTNFIANGQRSIEGIPSIIVSVPGLSDASVIGSKAELNQYRGLGSILIERGYTTTFHHGGTTGTMGFDAFAHVAGFTKYFGKEDYPSFSDSVFDGAWGICDEPFFLDAAQRMNTFTEPFCSVIFSLTSHDPYTIPDHRKNLFTSFKDESDIERAVRYSDFSLGQFFHFAGKQTWFANTLFIITADHTEFATRNKFHATYHIPMLLYAPDIIRAQKVNRVGSHVDILPTIIDLLHIPTVHASMGSSLIDTSLARFAVVKYGPYFGIFGNQYLFVSDFEIADELYEYQKPLPACNVNFASTHGAEVQELKKKHAAYLQCVTSAMAKDKIYREGKAK